MVNQEITMKYFMLLIIVLIPIVYTQWSPMITFISPNQIKNINEKTEFQCSVQDAGLSSVVWLKVNDSDISFLSLGSLLVTKNSRISVKYNEVNLTYLLEIKDIQLEDAGLYRCEIILSATRKIIAEVELQVQKPPEN